MRRRSRQPGSDQGDGHGRRNPRPPPTSIATGRSRSLTSRDQTGQAETDSAHSGLLSAETQPTAGHLGANPAKHTTRRTHKAPMNNKVAETVNRSTMAMS